MDNQSDGGRWNPPLGAVKIEEDDDDVVGAMVTFDLDLTDDWTFAYLLFSPKKEKEEKEGSGGAPAKM